MLYTIMVVLVDVRLPLVEFDADVSLGLPADTEVEFDRLVPRGRAEVAPFAWVRTDDFEGFERAAADHPGVSEIESLGETGDRRLYRVDWTPRAGLYDAVVRTDAAIVEGGLDEESLRLHLRFPDDESVTRFGALCAEAGLQMTPVRISRSGRERRGSGLTDEQRETLCTAFRLGYFDVPRRATLLDVADELDVSDQAVSERIRRGVRRLVGANVVSAD